MKNVSNKLAVVKPTIQGHTFLYCSAPVLDTGRRE